MARPVYNRNTGRRYYPYRRRGVFFHRYYPHRHYYFIPGYRSASHSSSSGGVLLALGIMLLVVGIIGAFLFKALFVPFVVIGVILIVFGVLVMIFAAMGMARLRSQNPDSNAQPQDNYSDNTNNSSSNTPQQGTGKCPNCGATSSGSFCEFCGAKLK